MVDGWDLSSVGRRGFTICKAYIKRVRCAEFVRLFCVYTVVAFFYRDYAA